MAIEQLWIARNKHDQTLNSVHAEIGDGTRLYLVSYSSPAASTNLLVPSSLPSPSLDARLHSDPRDGIAHVDPVDIFVPATQYPATQYAYPSRVLPWSGSITTRPVPLSPNALPCGRVGGGDRHVEISRLQGVLVPSSLPLPPSEPTTQGVGADAHIVAELAGLFAPRADGVVDCEHSSHRMTFAHLHAGMINVSLLISVVDIRILRPVAPISQAPRNDSVCSAAPLPRPGIQLHMTAFLVPTHPDPIASKDDDDEEELEGSIDRRWLDGCTLVVLARDLTDQGLGSDTFEIHVENLASKAVSELLGLRPGHVLFLQGLSTRQVPIPLLVFPVHAPSGVDSRLICELR